MLKLQVQTFPFREGNLYNDNCSYNKCSQANLLINNYYSSGNSYHFFKSVFWMFLFSINYAVLSVLVHEYSQYMHMRNGSIKRT